MSCKLENVTKEYQRKAHLFSVLTISFFSSNFVKGNSKNAKKKNRNKRYEGEMQRIKIIKNIYKQVTPKLNHKYNQF